MPLTVDELIVEIRTDQKRLKKDLKKVQSDLKKSGTKAATGFGASFKTALAGIGIGIAIKKAFDFAGVAKDAAAAAEEIKNKLGEVFKGIETGSEVRELAKDFDLAASTAEELIGNTGDLLVGLKLNKQEALEFSTAVVALSGDLTSFKDVQGGIVRTTESITKALLGERESLKDTIKTSLLESEVKKRAIAITRTRTELTLAQAKAFATLELIQEKNTAAVGDYARTKDSATNAERAFQEQIKGSTEAIGNLLLPAYTSFFSIVTPLLKDQTRRMKEFFGVWDREASKTRVSEWEIIFKPFSKSELESEVKILEDELKKLEGTITFGATFKGITGYETETYKEDVRKINELKEQLRSIRNLLNPPADNGGGSEVVKTLSDDLALLERTQKGLIDTSEDLTEAEKEQLASINQQIISIKELIKERANLGSAEENYSGTVAGLQKSLQDAKEARDNLSTSDAFAIAQSNLLVDSLTRQINAYENLGRISAADVDATGLQREGLDIQEGLGLGENGEGGLFDKKTELDFIPEWRTKIMEALHQIEAEKDSQQNDSLTAAVQLGQTLITGFRSSGNVLLDTLQQGLQIALSIATAINSANPLGIVSSIVGGAVTAYTALTSEAPSSSGSSGGVINAPTLPTIPSSSGSGSGANTQAINTLNTTLQAQELNRQINRQPLEVVVNLDGQEVGRGLLPEMDKLTKQGFNG